MTTSPVSDLQITFESIRRRLALFVELGQGPGALEGFRTTLLGGGERGLLGAGREILLRRPRVAAEEASLLTDAEIGIIAGGHEGVEERVRLLLALVGFYLRQGSCLPIGERAAEALVRTHPRQPRGLVLDFLSELDPERAYPGPRDAESVVVVPILLVEREGLAPRVAYLNLERIGRGDGLFYAAPGMAFVAVDEAWTNAERGVREYLQGVLTWPREHDVRWSICWSRHGREPYRGLELAGSSAGLALAIGLGRLLSRVSRPRGMVHGRLVRELRQFRAEDLIASGFLASMSADGRLAAVGHPERKLEAGGSIRVVLAASGLERRARGLLQAVRGGSLLFCGTYKEAVRLLAVYWRLVYLKLGLAVACAGWLALGVGCVLRTDRLSYDAALAVGSRPAPTNIVLVGITEATFLELGREPDGTLSRAHLARFLDRLTSEGARLVILDLLLAEKSASPAHDDRLADAIRRNGRAILAGMYLADETAEGLIETAVPPDARFRSQALAWGPKDVVRDPDSAVRALKTSWGLHPTAVWCAATNLGTAGGRAAGVHTEERWLRYYGSDPERDFPHCTFHAALDPVALPVRYFSNKIVLVGSASRANAPGALSDEFATPWTRFGGRSTSGMAIHATALANLLDGTWLRRIPYAIQILILAGLGYFGVWTSRDRRPWVASGLILASHLFAAVASCWVVSRYHLWWDWFLPLAAQASTALLGRWWIRRPGSSVESE